MFFRSIRWRIIIPYLLLFLIAMAALGWVLSANHRQNRLQELETQLSQQAALLAEASTSYFQTGADPADIDAVAKRWGGLLGSRVTLIDADGVVVGESEQDPTEMDNHLNRDEIQAAIVNGKGMSMRFSPTIGVEFMYSAVSLSIDQELVGFARVSRPVEVIEADLIQLRRTIVASTALIAAGVIIVGLWVARRTSRSIMHLNTAVRLLEKGDLRERLVPQTEDEVGRLTRSFNAMVEKLEIQFDNLEAERAKLAAVLDQMTDGVLMVDERGQVQLMNRAAEELFAAEFEDTSGRSLVEIVRNHHLFELWRKCDESRQEQTDSFQIGPAQQFIRAVAIPFDTPLTGNVLLLLRDLTRVKRLETIRQDFVSNISHELRTPLASLKALVETLSGGAIEDPPAANRFLGQIENEVNSLTQIVQELLELSRIESGKVPLKLVAVSPLNLLESVIDRLGLQAEKASLTLQVDCDPDLPEVWADPPRVEQVLLNLLHNAIKFTGSGGGILIAAEQEQDRVVFMVRDTGVGIPADDLSRIFERFYKTDRARSSGGTGLGLAIAKHLIEAHSGAIWAESVEGQGSTFYFSLPVAI